MTIVDESKLTPHQRKLWNTKALRLSRMGVTVIDPWRRPLRKLREELEAAGQTGLLYRASTGGSWGKSAQFVRI